ncbi:29826_t:CDS:2 [Gigaspora margarita]|uniref:29826_t:CDS:1 n=1 Tax=Gigaspora margarita TaxID=4874 RepID=A0ABN7VZZ1_GIGMA|nr:29826_t:CDS:2 [Gigaspora margarita]
MLIKAESNKTLALYCRDHKDKYMCSNCYNAIVVNGMSAFKKHAVELKRGNDPLMVSFSQLQSITESKNDQLNFFFNEIEAMAYEFVESGNNLMWVEGINILTMLLYN